MAKQTKQLDEKEKREIFGIPEQHLEKKLHRRFVCKLQSTEKDKNGDALYGLPAFAVHGIENIKSTTTMHSMDIRYYAPISPAVEDHAFEFLMSGQDFTVTIQDIGPVGDIVCEKVYSNCKILSMIRSDYAYDDKEPCTFVLSIVAGEMKYTSHENLVN